MKNPCKPENDQISIDIRRYQNMLMVSGSGVLMFGMWSVIKTALVVLLDPDSSTRKELRALEMDTLNTTQLTITIVLLVIVFAVAIAISLSFRFIVFLNARREGRGVSKSNTYLFIAGLLVISSMISIITIVYSFFKTEKLDYSDATVGLTVEITSLITVIELMNSAIRIRKLREKQEAM